MTDYPLTLISFTPDQGRNKGKTIWIFRGLVPVDLARVCDAVDPLIVADYDRTSQIAGHRIAENIALRAGHKYEARVFESEQAARRAAIDLGYEVTT